MFRVFYLNDILSYSIRNVLQEFFFGEKFPLIFLTHFPKLKKVILLHFYREQH